MTSGYESPKENTRSPFFTSYTTDPLQSSPLCSNTVANRPPFSPRQSFASERQLRTAGGNPTGPENGGPQGLGDSRAPSMRSGDEEGSPNVRVSIRDRIACYQWTWFTMVCCSLSVPREPFWSGSLTCPDYGRVLFSMGNKYLAREAYSCVFL